ncbi:MAG: hypothetical protein ABGX16_09655 [Pirellulales bacterium]
MNRANTKKRSCCTALIAASLTAALLSATSHAANFTWDGQISSSWGGSRNVGSAIVPKIISNW